MNTRTWVLLATALWVVLAAAVGWIVLRSYSSPAPDGRVEVAVSPAEREFVLGEMRTMLATVQRITDGLAGGKREQVVQAARASGAAGMAVQPALMLKLPAPFKQLSTQLHAGFDGIADAAQADAPAGVLLGRLSGELGTCVACHAAYRLKASEAR